MLRLSVERATLRPVPLRPSGPVDPADALAHVLAALPDLHQPAAQALSLIEIAGRTRDSAVEEMDIGAESLGELLYVARKALRRSMFPLSASGWCERAERLLSDRIDGALRPPGPARLDVHLRNCERCVEHERRLAQAREKLVREFIEAHPTSGGAGPAERPAAALRVVAPVVVEAPVYDGPVRTVAGFAGVASVPDDGEMPSVGFAGPGGQVEIRVDPATPVAAPEPVAGPEPVVEAPAYDGPLRTVAGFAGVVSEPDEGELPSVSFAGPGGQVEIRLEAPVATPAADTVPDADELPEDPPLDDDVSPAEPGDTSPSEHDAEEKDPPVDDTEAAVELAPLDDPAEFVAPALVSALNPATLVWGSLTLLSVGLAIFALVVTALALSGVQHIF
ncbi:MAG: hypothetical protein QOC55_2086 [Thermoleophilaceae bacterium]|nr:hypothetical protein [Thermoleophilaceae bacterium]